MLSILTTEEICDLEHGSCGYDLNGWVLTRAISDASKITGLKTDHTTLTTTGGEAQFIYSLNNSLQ